MNKEKQTADAQMTSQSETGKWVNGTIGVFLLTRRITGATNRTVIGRFLTYSFAYLFGLFYPLARIVIGFYGLYRIYAKKALPLKKYALGYLGTALLFLSVLAFGSISFFAESGNLSLASLNPSYNDLRLSFAREPFYVDNFSSLSGLGGGYIGLFLVTVFGAIWKVPGDIVFFLLLLFLALFLILFRPVTTEWEYRKRKKANRVSYSSPYKKEKVKKSFLHRSNEQSKEQGENGREDKPLPRFDRQQDSSKDDVRKNETPDLSSGTKEERNPIPQARKKSYSPTERDDARERRKRAESFRQSFSQNKQDLESVKAKEAPLPSPRQKKEAPNPSADFSPSLASAGQKEEKPRRENPFRPFASPNLGKREKTRDRKKETEESVSPSPSMEMAEKEETASSFSPSLAAQGRSNPLEGPYQARKQAYKETPSQEVMINADDLPSQDAPELTRNVSPSNPNPNPEKERTEEEKEDIAVKQYFDEKHRRESEKLRQKKQKERRKKAQFQEYAKETLAYNYPFPTDDLLDEHDDSAKIQINQEAAQKKAVIINNALKDFGIRARATSFTIGASVTRFNVLTDSGEKADKIASLTDDLQRYLNGDKSVRVETVVEGRSTSGIEVGNQAPRAVSFKDVFQKVETNTTENLLLPIGKDISGEIVTYPLNKMPHLLVAGSTGSGKSVLIHSMIVTLLRRNYPNQRKLRLIDPKQVEFSLYKDCPHLLCPVISNPSQAIRALSKLCVERDRRFSLLSTCHCMNLGEYNALRVSEPSKALEERPAIVCIIDEFADLRQTGGKELPEYVCRIAQKARAAGIYLIIATQRPDRDVVPSLIKSNIACRIGLRCASRVNSQVILDENGAETLLGKGDLLFKCPGKKSMVRCQSAYLSNEEITRVLDYLKKKAGKPHYNPEFLDLEPAEKENSLGADGQVSDPDEFRYNSVKDFVCRTGRCSKALLRRTFSLTTQKATDRISRLLIERIVERGPGGTYTLGLSAEEYLQEHDN